MAKAKETSRKPKKTRRKKTKALFVAMALLLVANLLQSFLRYLDADHEYRIFDHTYTVAVLPGQDVQNLERLDAGVIRLEKPRWENLVAGDRVVYAGNGERLLPLDDETVPVVAEVVGVEEDRVHLTYNGTNTVTASPDTILGLYAGNASLLGIYHYGAMFPLGLVILALASIFLLWAYHIMFLARGERHTQSLREETVLHGDKKLSL